MICLMVCGMSLPVIGKAATKEPAGKTEPKSPQPTPTDKEMIELLEMLKIMEILREMEMLQDYHLISGEDTHEKEN